MLGLIDRLQLVQRLGHGRRGEDHDLNGLSRLGGGFGLGRFRFGGLFGGLGLDGGLGFCGVLGLLGLGGLRLAAGRQRKHHAQRKQQCQDFFHVYFLLPVFQGNEFI